MVGYFLFAGFVIYLAGAGWWIVDVVRDRAPLSLRWKDQARYQRVYSWMQAIGCAVFVLTLVIGLALGK